MTDVLSKKAGISSAPICGRRGQKKSFHTRGNTRAGTSSFPRVFGKVYLVLQKYGSLAEYPARAVYRHSRRSAGYLFLLGTSADSLCWPVWQPISGYI